MKKNRMNKQPKKTSKPKKAIKPLKKQSEMSGPEVCGKIKVRVRKACPRDQLVPEFQLGVDEVEEMM